ncbi:MAG TPA: lysophospholipid acyltransferase family protein [Myxococcota bacterium]|nr:lysophospholipid acyltransferase family protein [Myxococcota bacterium]HRY94494.1 lysophospholipid acyltransferase family protein [Myxococcota bacterium]HSA20058.1 lysophospholipid acyltransferase family protein [Myxococcota bacterium]
MNHLVNIDSRMENTSNSVQPVVAVEREPGHSRRTVLRWLYFPWTWLVFIPFLLVTTLLWGCLAVLTSFASRRVAFHCGTVWAWCLCLMNFTWVSVRGRERADPKRSYVIMSNHQSHFDILAFYGFWGRQFRWVMKQELRKVPFLGWGCAGVGHIFIDRSDREKAIASLRAARGLLEGGVSVMIFPEGTRSTSGRLREFKKGGFMLALELGLPILPVSISGSRHVLPNRTKRLLPGRVRIQVHPPIEVAGLGVEARDELMARVAEAIRSGLSPWEQQPLEPRPGSTSR